ncbi:MAG: hypothetical protein ACON4K_08630 [Akkermansiaceae bacterium]
MNLTPDDPRLTAYALDELSNAEAAKVREGLEDDFSIKAEVELTQALSSLLEGALANGSLELGRERREEIHRSGKRPDDKVLLKQHQRRSRWQSLAAVAGVAAAVVFGFYLLSEISVEGKAPISDMGELGKAVVEGRTPASEVQIEEGRQTKVAVGEEAYQGSMPVLDELIVVTQRTGVKIPFVGRADLAGYQRSLEREEVSSLRIEELINTPFYELKPEVQLEDVGINAEFGPCPWNGDAHLLMVTFRDLKEDGVSPQVEARLLLDAPQVASIRLVASGMVRGNSSQRNSLEDGRSSAVLYELVLNESEGRFAAVDLTVNDRSAFLPVFKIQEEDVSFAFQTACVLARFGKWSGGGESSELQEIANDARALLSEVSESTARFALDLILITAESRR